MKLIFYYKKENRYSFNALAGSLEKNKEVLNRLKLYFLTNEEDLFSALNNSSDDGQKVVICFSYATMQVPEIHPLIKKIKLLHLTNTFIIAGGPHPSGNPYSSLNSGANLIVRGEGEEVFPEVLLKMLNNEDFSKVKNLAFFKNGEYKFTGYNKNKVNLNLYPPFSDEFKKFGPIEITRGCPYGCKYCQTSYLLGNMPRHRSVEQIIEHVKIMKDLGLLDFRVITPNAFSYGSLDGKQLNIEAIENLLSSVRSLIGGKGRIFYGSFPSEVRPEHVNDETLRIAKKYINNNNLVIGAQTGSQSLLNYINRQHKVEDIYNAVELCIKYGFKVNIDFIFGLPTETEDDINESLIMIEKLCKMGVRIHGHTFMPLPQTPFKNEKGGKISNKLKKELRRLVSIGAMYGDWEKQEFFVNK